MNIKLITAFFALTAFTTACDPASIVNDVRARTGSGDPSVSETFKADLPGGGGCDGNSSCKGPTYKN